MVKRRIQICNQSGLHLRPAGQLCQKAMEYPCRITMVIGNKSYNLKSMLSVLSAQVNAPKEIELICEGEGEEKALEELAGFLSEDLDEKLKKE